MLKLVSGLFQIFQFNPPHKVRLTTRLNNFRRLSTLKNVIIPQTELFILEEDLLAVVNSIESTGLKYPIIMRQRGSQTGRTVERILNHSMLFKWLSDQKTGDEVYATDYLDCRWRDGYYHKSRVFFIDGQLFPVANLTSDLWQIHSGDRYRIMSKLHSTQEDEKRFLKNPEAYLGDNSINALYAIKDMIDLDFFGIDFTVDMRGNVIIFEANAAMRHNFDHVASFPYTQPYLETITEAFTQMLYRRIDSCA